MSDKLIAIRGEFEATDWQIGLFDERDRIAKQYGVNGNINSVTSFSYEGSIKRLGSHIASRMSYLKGLNRSVGEIVRLEKPIGYIRLYIDLKEVKNDGDFVSLKDMEYACQMSTKRYCVLEMRNGHLPPQYKYLRSHYDLSDAKKEIFGILRSSNNVFGNNAMNHYYIFDLKERKAYRCYPDGQELKTTTRKSDDLQIITPKYRYFYYGYAETYAI